jgi:hypothetical protein
VLMDTTLHYACFSAHNREIKLIFAPFCSGKNCQMAIAKCLRLCLMQ